MNIQEFYKDAFKIHFITHGDSEFEAENKAKEIVSSIEFI